MIMCCRRQNEPLVRVFLRSDNEFRDRKLEVAICAVCGTLIAELTQFNIKKGVYEVIRPKSKKTAKFIKKMQEMEWFEIELPKGTKSNMNYIYGVNREYKNGKICQYAVDFNGVKKLVKIIEAAQKSKN